MLWGATYCELCQVSVQILSHGDQTDNKNSVRGCNRKSSNKQADFWGELNLKFMILIVLKLKGNTLGDSKVPIFIFLQSDFFGCITQFRYEEFLVATRL